MIDIKLLKAARTFYLNTNELHISDEEYDKLYIDSGLTKSELFDLIGVEQDRNHQFENIEMKFPKLKYKDNKFLPPLKDGEYDTMKFDGSSIKVIYKNGKLANILSASGISQLRKLQYKVPREVDPSIETIYCEAVVRYSEFGDGARSKANGLITSKKMQEDVDKYLHLIAVYPLNVDPYGDFFHVAEKIYNIQDLPTSNIYKDFMVDGVVRYGEDPKIFKLYYVEVKETVVKGIDIRRTSKKNLSASLIIEPVKLDGFNQTSVSPNGIDQIYEKGLGKGAVIKVARSGSTIAQVIDVISPSYDIHIQCGCGRELNREHVDGLTVRCPDLDCSERLNDMREEFDQWITGGIDFIISDLKYNYFNMLSLEGYNIKKLTLDPKDIPLYEKYLRENNKDSLFVLTAKSMNLKTDRSLENLKYKIHAYLKVLNEKVRS